MSELWNVYDYFRNDTGRLIPRGARMRLDEYHLVVNVWLRNARGEYLISQRSPEKSHPLCWEATGGSVLAGETSVQGAVREVEEELGIRLNPEEGVLICSGTGSTTAAPTSSTCGFSTATCRSRASCFRRGKPWMPDTLPPKRSGAWFNPGNSFQWRNSITCRNWGYDGIAGRPEHCGGKPETLQLPRYVRMGR